MQKSTVQRVKSVLPQSAIRAVKNMLDASKKKTEEKYRLSKSDDDPHGWIGA